MVISAGTRIQNLTRVEVLDSPDTSLVHASVDPSNPNVFFVQYADDTGQRLGHYNRKMVTIMTYG